MSRLERHLVISVLVLFAVPAAVGTMLLVVAYRAGAFDRSPSAMLTAIVVGLFVVLAYAAVAAHGIGRSFVRNLSIGWACGRAMSSRCWRGTSTGWPTSYARRA